MTQPFETPYALDHLFDQRFRASEILITESDSSGLPLSRKRQNAINRLKHASHPTELVSSPELVPFVPLLGALHRDDVVQTRTALQVLELEDEPRRLLSRLFPNYISVLVFIYLLVFGFQAYFVMPMFEKMFNEFQLRLPALTAACVFISKIFRDYAGPIILGFVVIYILWGATLTTRGKLSYYLSRIPLIGFLFAGNNYSLKDASKVSLITAELIDSHFHPATALAIANGNSSSRGVNLSEQIDSNAPSQVILPSSIQLPFSIQQLLRQSPLTKSHTNSMRDLAQIYGQRATLSNSRSLEPFMTVGILFLGALVGLIIMSLFLPLVSLVTSLA